MTTDPTSLLDQQVHFLGLITVPTSTSMWAPSVEMHRGDVLTVTDEILEAGFTRDRAHWLELVADPQAQVERFGSVKYGRGPFPADENPFDPDDIPISVLMNQPYRTESFETKKYRAA